MHVLWDKLLTVLAGVNIHLKKINNIAEIMGFDIMSTPGVVVDGEVVQAGGVPGSDQACAWVRR